MSLLLSLGLLISIPLTACDAEETGASTNSDDKNTVQPRGFTRNYDAYLSPNEQIELMRGWNYDLHSDTTVTVTYNGTEGPGTISVVIQYKDDDAATWNTGKTANLSLSDSISLDIPEDNSFRVMVTSTSEVSGTAYFVVSLSE